MTVDFKLPHLGENISSADIVKINVAEGDKVEVDQVVIEIETDKATVEVPSDISGIVKKVYVKEGTKANVGEPIISVEADSQQSVDSMQSAVSSEKLDVNPKSESLTTDHQSPIINHQSPIINHPLRQVEDEASQPPITDHQPFQKIEHTHSPTVVTLPLDVVKIVVPAAPSVRRFAREIGVDIHQVRGSGQSGRISIEDVKAYAKALNEQIQVRTASVVGVARETLPDFSKWGAIDRQPMSNIRRKTAEHLSYAWSAVPHVTQFDKADITDLEKLRRQFGKKVEEAGGKLTVTAVLLKVLASALKIFPQFNSSVDMEKNEIVYKKFYNIGIAVDTDRGLLVPVIRNVDKKNIVQLSIELQEVSKKARDKKLSPDDMQGGCFTISNLGGIGGTYFTPIVNSPEVAILGVSRSSYESVYIDNKPASPAGGFEPRLMMPLSLSYDHRIIDGADGIRFLRWIVSALENPFLLLLEG